MRTKIATIHNEFAAVELFEEVGTTGVRLVIRDMRSGQTIVLDALELERLAHGNHAALAEIVRSAYADLRSDLEKI